MLRAIFNVPGEELFSAFIELVKKCDGRKTSYASLMKLVKWIDDREYFWSQQSKFSFSYTSLRESVYELNIANSETSSISSTKLSPDVKTKTQKIHFYPD